MSHDASAAIQVTEEQENSAGWKTRIGAFFALAGVVGAVAFVLHTAWFALHDSFVAPIALSPESEVVITMNLRVRQLLAEEANEKAEMERLDVELPAGAKAIARLESLLRESGETLRFVEALSSEQAKVGDKDLQVLVNRDRALDGMTAKQEQFVEELRRDMEAGLVSRAEYLKEAQSLSRMRLGSIDNERARLTTSLLLNEARMTRAGLKPGRGAPRTPAAIESHHTAVRLELELLKLEAEQRALEAKRRAVVAGLAQIDELKRQMSSRPIYRAIQSRMDVAFVPYDQLAGVQVGSSVYECVWGLFACKRVGSVTEVLPGEVAMPDPWGAQARGQYAIMDLAEVEASQSTVLRVRPTGGRETVPARHELSDTPVLSAVNGP